MKGVTDLKDLIWSAVPAMPTLGREVKIPVYVIHNSGDAEDYFFIFDFEEFVERSRGGMFVRPKLEIVAGRDDFSRTLFARQMREAFAVEFDAARQALMAETRKGRGIGWLGWDMGFDAVSSLVASFIANVFLLLAVTTGRAVLSALPIPGWAKGRSKEVKLEDRIVETQAKVDAALMAAEITIHRDLQRHAGQDAAGKADLDAWPLPGNVVRHLDDGRSSSWW